jgi:hypothetical protein
MMSKVSWIPPVAAENPNRGLGNGGQWGYAAPVSAAPTYVAPAEVNHAGAGKDDSKKKMMVGAAAGVAVGALGGMAMNSALGSSFTLLATPSICGGNL